MWQELQQFVSVGLAYAAEEEGTLTQHMYSWNNPNNKRLPKEPNASKQNIATGQGKQGTRPYNRKQKPTGPVIFENKGLKSAFRPKTATG